VIASLLPRIENENRIVMLAGRRYCESLVEPLFRRGFEVVLPLEHLRQGEQLAWLSAQL
jgi:hypothetical protein